MSIRLVDHGWQTELHTALRADRDVVRIISPFIKRDAAARILALGEPKTLEVITRFDLRDFASNVSDTSALRLLLDAGARIRGVKRLHAKLYLLGEDHAIVTSANLTGAGLGSNHELGVVAENDEIASACKDYFLALWNRAGNDLDAARIDRWDGQVEPVRAAGGRPSAVHALPDDGTEAGPVAAANVPLVFEAPLADAPQSLVKFFGRGGERSAQNTDILDEVRRSGSHWACTYPRRPWRVQEGAVVYLARMVRGPKDHRIYGRAIARAHDAERDEASAEEIAHREWKDHFRYYIRVDNVQLIDGPLSEGVSLYELVEALGPEAFQRTHERQLAGETDINPKRTYARQPDVLLTFTGAAWIEARLQEAFRRTGLVQPRELERLDWPTRPRTMGALRSSPSDAKFVASP